MISKKSLIAAAVLSTMAAGAMAANVTLYGVIDESLVFSSKNLKDGKGNQKSFSMESGNRQGARWGMKGVEEIGSVKVGFQLEGGFAADTGALAQGSRLFGRQSTLFVEGAYGHVAVGRFGTLTSGCGSYDIAGSFNPFTTSYSAEYAPETGMNLPLMGGRIDNAIVYKTPKFAGLQVSAMYSLKNDGKDGKGTEGKTTSDRYAGIGATYANGPFNAAVAVSTINNATTPGSKSPEDSLLVFAGANYNLGVAKLQASVGYFEEVAKLDKELIALPGKMTGYGVTLGATIPACGGNVLVGAGYTDAEEADSVAAGKEFDFKRMSFGLGYEYSFSKRTMAYTVAGYTKDEIKTDAGKVKPSAYAVTVGLRHSF